MVIQGNCIEVMQTMKDESFDLIFADPPYNLQMGWNELKRPGGSVYRSGLVNAEWDKFESFNDYVNFTENWLIEAKRIMKRKSSIWVSGTYHNIFIVGYKMMELGFEILNHIVWIKDKSVPSFKGVRFTPSHESLIWAKKKKGIHYFNYRQLKEENGNRQVRADWHFPIITNSEKIFNASYERINPAQKPEHLLYRIITATSKKGDSVLDPFCGTGTTGKVCVQLGREFTGIELDPIQAEIAEQRIQSTVELLF